MRSRSLLLLMVVLAITMAACASGSANNAQKADENIDVVEDPMAPDSVQADSSGFAVDGGLTVAEALAYEGTETIAVQGYLVVDGQTGLLCEVLAESYPPQCGGQSLAVTNPEAASGAVLVEEGEIQWSEQPLTLFGHVSNGQLTIDATTNG
jgi:hypothetical protein